MTQSKKENYAEIKNIYCHFAEPLEMYCLYAKDMV